MTRDEALALLREHLKNENLIKHCLATEAIMGEMAARLGHDAQTWRLAGLIHDLDFEETKDTPSQHTLKAAEILQAKGVSLEVIQTIKAHNAEQLGLRRESVFEHALACAETVTGLIVAAALVQPDKKLASVKPESVIKRMKKKDFARNVSRDIILECETIGVPLAEFVALSLKAMCGIAADLGL